MELVGKILARQTDEASAVRGELSFHTVSSRQEEVKTPRIPRNSQTKFDLIFNKLQKLVLR